MDVVAAGAANASGETEADGSEANGATAKAVAYASVATARAEAKIHASVTAAAKTNAVTAAAAKAKTHAAVTSAAAEAKTHAVTPPPPLIAASAVAGRASARARVATVGKNNLCITMLPALFSRLFRAHFNATKVWEFRDKLARRRAC